MVSCSSLGPDHSRATRTESQTTDFPSHWLLQLTHTHVLLQIIESQSHRYGYSICIPQPLDPCLYDKYDRINATNFFLRANATNSCYSRCFEQMLWTVVKRKGRKSVWCRPFGLQRSSLNWNAMAAQTHCPFFFFWFFLALIFLFTFLLFCIILCIQSFQQYSRIN